MSFYAKSVSFWPNEWIFKYSDKIMSCKLWSKVTSVFLNINFCAKMSILGKKNWISWEMLIFSNNCALLLKVNNLLENMLIFRKLWLSIYTVLIKKFFLGNVYVHVSISFVGKLLFWFKIWFYSVIFWKKCHFPSKIYISGGINFLALFLVKNLVRKYHFKKKCKNFFVSVSFWPNEWIFKMV